MLWPISTGDPTPADCQRSRGFNLHGLRTLVVEDQPESRDVLTRALNGFGARNGRRGGRFGSHLAARSLAAGLAGVGYRLA